MISEPPQAGTTADGCGTGRNCPGIVWTAGLIRSSAVRCRGGCCPRAFLELQRCWGAEPKTREVADRDLVSKPASIASYCRAWLFRTVRNKAFNCQRSHRRRTHYEADYSQQRRWFVETTHSALEAQEATEALGHLPEELRETVVARIWGGLTLEQIAVLTHVSLATAQRRYVRAIEQLRLRLDDQPQRSKRVQRNQL